MIFKQENGFVVLFVYVQPGASKSEIVGVYNGALKIRIHSPPVDGKANEALVEFLAKFLGLAKRNVVIFKGDSNRSKVIHLYDVQDESLNKIKSFVSK